MNIMRKLLLRIFELAALFWCFEAFCVWLRTFCALIALNFSAQVLVTTVILSLTLVIIASWVIVGVPEELATILHWVSLRNLHQIQAFVRATKFILIDLQAFLQFLIITYSCLAAASVKVMARLRVFCSFLFWMSSFSFYFSSCCNFC